MGNPLDEGPSSPSSVALVVAADTDNFSFLVGWLSVSILDATATEAGATDNSLFFHQGKRW